jgi:hypothetical protein
MILPEPGLPNNVLTAVLFIVMFVVPAIPSSTFTWFRVIVLPDDGSAID